MGSDRHSELDSKLHSASEWEMVGKRFSQSDLHAARDLTWKALAKIAAVITPGMTEKLAIQQANAILSELGARRLWHRTHVRFGKSTVLGFDDPYSEGVTLGERDIFYVDIGPVFLGHEGDAGATFILGDDPTMIAIQRDVKVIFDRVSAHWAQSGASGEALYRFAQREAKELGWLLAPPYVRGHRISDFPHQVFGEGSLADCSRAPSPDRWVLEIQIRHPSLPLGGFYEDLLKLVPLDGE